MIKVSVILTIHDDGQFLPECLNSLCRQTLKDIEIICINDASTDNSAEILKYYASRDRRIKVINQHDIGPTACRNWGLVAAQGKYVSIIEAADWVDPAFYEKLYNVAVTENDDIACCSLMLIDGEQQTEPALKYTRTQRAKTLTQKFKLLNMPQSNYICNKIYRRDFINKQELYFDENIDISRGSPKIMIFNENKELVREFDISAYNGMSGYLRFSWDSRDNQGNALPSGAYNVIANYNQNLDGSVNIARLGRGEVQSVIFNDGKPHLRLGELIVPLEEALEFYAKK